VNNGVPKESCHKHIADIINGRVNMYFMGFSICLSIALITMGVYVSAILYRASKSLRNYCKKSKQKSDIENEKKDNDKDTVEMPGRDRSEKYR